jgi:N-acetylglucosamine-6-phosphate deacetylase
VTLAEYVLSNARVVLPDRVVDRGWVRVSHGLITEVGEGRPGGLPHIDLDGQWLLPGFVDIHMHGGGGHDATLSPSALRGAVDFHRGHGTTRTLVSLVTASVAQLETQLGWVADATDDATSTVVGAHLEGPFLSHVRCGAQNPSHLQAPDPVILQRLLTAARNSLRSITIAPELPGAAELIRMAVGAGAVAAIGHTDATYAQALDGIAAGATLATHLFNGMRPIHHREPGPVWAALNADLWCEVVNDGVHVDLAIVELVGRVPGRLVLITDAMDATGMPDGEYDLGGQAVKVLDGEARLAASGVLAGSTLTMDDAVRRAVLECGLTISAASAAASGTPARVIGEHDKAGSIEVGKAADVVALDGDLRVRSVAVAGRWDRDV